MTNPLFTLNSIKKTFTVPSTLAAIGGASGSALSTVSQNLGQIGSILGEGNVAGDQFEFAMQKVYEAKLACEAAIVTGWNHGQGVTR